MITLTSNETDERGDVQRVLVADDDRDTAQTLGILLRSEGYIVYVAKNGTEALRYADAYRPDVALLDLHMPERSGFDVASELQRRYGSNCPVLIALTGHLDMKTREVAEISGFHHFVAKPYDSKALLQLIGSLKRIAY